MVRTLFYGHLSKGLTIAFVTLLLLPAIVSADQTTNVMTSTQIRKTVAGNTTIGTFSDRALSYAVYVAEDGRLIARLSNGNSTRIEFGSWRVANDRLYGRWDKLKDGKENSFEYRLVGSNVHAYRQDGSLDRIQFFVKGDPLGLSNYTPSKTDATMVQEKTQEWLKLWNPGKAPVDQARFSRFAELFAEADSYSAFDDFTGEVLSIRGYVSYAKTWIPVMAAFEFWNIEVVGDIDVNLSGDQAIATFKFKGNGRLKAGKSVTGFTYATLIWRKISGEWRLVHEHLTGSQT